MSEFSEGEIVSGRAAFLSGLLTPSLLSVSLALISAIGIFLAVFVTAERLAGSPWAGYAANTPRDHSVFVTSEVLRLRAVPPEGQPPLLAVVGASVTRSSFGTEAQIAEAMREATGQDVEVAVLATGLQGIIEHIAIIETLLTGRPAWFVLGLGSSRFSATIERTQKMVLDPELGFRSPAVNGYAEAIGLIPFEATGHFLSDNYRFWLARFPKIPLNLLKGPPRQDETTWLGKRMRPAAFEERARLAYTRFDSFDANFERNLLLLDRLIERLKQHPEVRLVIVEHAVNPVFVRDWMGADFYAAYLERMRAWAAERQVDYLTLALDANFPDEDFFDWAHISSPEASARLRADLTAHLATEPLP